MKKLYKTIFLILLCTLLSINFLSMDVYAKSEREELLELLDEYKDDVGDFGELKQVVDKTYDDLYSATTVDEDLKERLRSHVEELTKVSGMNPLIANVLEIEIQSQIDNLTDSNIDEVREEISVIKEWTDKNYEENNNEKNNINELNISNKVVDNSASGNKNTVINVSGNQNVASYKTLPFAGKINITLLAIIIIINIVFCIIKYKNLKGI